MLQSFKSGSLCTVLNSTVPLRVWKLVFPDMLLFIWTLFVSCVCVCVLWTTSRKLHSLQPPLLSLLKPPLIKCLTHASSYLSSSLLKPQTHPFFPAACVWTCVCVVCEYLCAVFPTRETGRHTSMKSTKPPLIPPVIYGSQIHVRLKLNKRSFVTDSSLWSGWIALAVSLLQQICPALSLLPLISAPAHICGLTVLKDLRQRLGTHVFLITPSLMPLIGSASTCDPC